MRSPKQVSRLLFLLAVLVVSLPASGASASPAPPAGRAYYVDPDAYGMGNGTSWADAWTSFGDIDWAVIHAGDVLYISGGTSSKTYSEMLDVKASGLRGRPIVVARGLDAGHDGEAIIDGLSSLAYGARGENRAFVVVSGLTVRNCVGSGQIRVRYSSDVTVENNRIHVTGHGGVYLHDNDRVTVRGNWITTPAYLAAQTDGIYSQLNVGNVYEGNHIVISNDETTGHDDGIQMYRDTSITVRGNYIEQDNTKVSNAQGIYATDSYGTFQVYNNVVYGRNTKNCLLTLGRYSQGDARLVAYNNTLVGGGWGVVYVKEAPDSVVQNNILASFQRNGWLFRLDGPLTDPRNVDYNVYYAPSSKITSTVNGTGVSWRDWQAGGYEAHGINADPLLVAIASRDISLSEGSPAVDSGIPVPSVPADFAGLPRPQGPGYDIGAFELKRSRVVRINAGGGAYVDPFGTLWAADQPYAPGGFGYVGGSSYSTAHPISGTDDDPLYQTERWGAASYRFDVPNGDYEVRLLFAEIYLNASYRRRFDVSVEGGLVLDDLDIYSLAGHDGALMRTFTVTVSDGRLDVDFKRGIEYPKVSAIEVTSSW